MNGRYILGGPDGHTPIQCEDLLEWARAIESGDKRRVALTEVNGVRVSTVFMGLDYSFSDDPDEPPVLFETMAFGAGDKEVDCDRCCTWDQAVKQHEEMVEKFKK